MNHFLNVLTLKGLDYVLTHSDDAEVRDAVRREMRRRKSVSHKHIVVDERVRDLDGYERDQ